MFVKRERARGVALTPHRAKQFNEEIAHMDGDGDYDGGDGCVPGR
jgi:hypothetical protein